MTDKMKWHCLDCHANFLGPKDRSPENGCKMCGSSHVFDCNVEYVSLGNLWGVFEKGYEIHVAPANADGQVLGHILDRICLCEPREDGRVIVHREN